MRPRSSIIKIRVLNSPWPLCTFPEKVTITDRMIRAAIKVQTTAGIETPTLTFVISRNTAIVAKAQIMNSLIVNLGRVK